MRFKDLNKTRKTEFIISIVLGSCLAVLGIISKNFISVMYGLFVIINTQQLLIDQVNDDIISDYEEMAERNYKGNKETYLTISEAIKNKDINFLNEIAEEIDKNFKD